MNPMYKPVKTTSMNPKYQPHKENYEDKDLFNSYVQQKKIKVRTPDEAASAFKMYESEKEQFKDFMAFDSFSKKSYSKLYNQINSDEALYGIVRSQYDYNKSRIQKGLEPLKYADPSFNPNEYDEDSNEYLSSFVSKNKRMPTEYDMLEFNKGLSEYKQEKQTKSFAGQGYKYTSTEEDSTRKEQGLPPLSFENTQKIQQALDSFYKEVEGAVSSIPTETVNANQIKRTIIQDIYNKYAILQEADAFAMDNSFDEPTFSELKIGTKTASAPFNIEALKQMGYDPKSGFMGLVDKAGIMIRPASQLSQPAPIKQAQPVRNDLAALTKQSGIGYVGEKALSGLVGFGVGLVNAAGAAASKEVYEKNDLNLLSNPVNPLKGMSTKKGIADNAMTFISNGFDNMSAVLERMFPAQFIAINAAKKTLVNLAVNDLTAKLTGNESAQEMTDKAVESLYSITDGYYENQQQLAAQGAQQNKFTQIAGDVAQGAAQMLPSIAVSIAAKNPQIGLATMATSAGGQAARDAYTRGANPTQAAKVGVMKGAVEYGTESMFGGIAGLGKGIISQGARKVLEGFAKSGLGKAVMKAMDIGGEGVEEIVSNALSSYIDRAVFDPEAKAATMNELLSDAGIAIAISAITQVPVAVNSIAKPKAETAQPVQPSQPTNALETLTKTNASKQYVAPFKLQATFKPRNDLEALTQPVKPKLEVISSKTNMGEIVREGDVVYKPTERKNGSKSLESEVYNALKDVDGIATATTVKRNGKDYISMPYYKNIISTDTIEKGKRERLAPIVKRNADRIVKAVEALSNAGYTYSDPLQFAINKDGDMDLMDFSNSMKLDVKEATERNYEDLRIFLQQFGADGYADVVSKAMYIKDIANIYTQKDLDEGMTLLNESQQTILAEVKKAGEIEANNVYYSRNARMVQTGGIAQVYDEETRNTYVISDKPLSAKTINDWELKPVYEQSKIKTNANPPAIAQNTANTEPVAFFRESAQKAGWDEQKIKGLESFVGKIKGIAPIEVMDLGSVNGVTVDGKYENGKVYINPNSVAPAFEVLKHEVTHALKTSKQGQKFYSSALSELKGLDEYTDLRQSIKDAYADVYAGDELESKIDDEMVSTFAETALFQDSASVQKFVQENRNLGQRFLGWIRELITGAKGTKEEQSLRKLEKLYVDALNATAKPQNDLTKLTQKTDAMLSLSDSQKAAFTAAMVKKYGAIKKGENAARDVSVPKQTSDNNRVSKFARTLIESEVVSDVQARKYQDEIAEGKHTYVPQSNADLLTKAKLKIEGYGKFGMNHAYDQISSIVKSGKGITATDVAMGEVLLAEALAKGDVEQAKKSTADLIMMATESGRAVNAFRIMKKFGKEGAMLTIQRVVDKKNQEIIDRFGEKAKDKKIEVPDELYQAIADAKNQAEIDKAVNNIGVYIAENLPSTWQDKVSHWRYLSMLGNPITHGRNFWGNVTGAVMRKVKNAIGAGLEKTGVFGIKVAEGERTKSLTTNKADREFAKADFNQNVDAIMSSGKFGIDESIEKNRTIFKTKAIEWARKFSLKWLEKSDMLFLRGAYVDSMAQYMKANGLSAESITDEQLQKAQNYATTEAQKATYRNANKAATALNYLSKMHPAAKFAVDAVVPFKKTPANILMRGLDYSFPGLVKSLSYNVWKVKTGKMTAVEFVDGVSAGLTGTGIMVVGALLASLGLVKGRDDEENTKVKQFYSMMGEQQYSLAIGAVRYSIDWMVPFSIPLIVGVEMFNSVNSGDPKEASKGLARIFDALTSIGDPMLDLSMLQGIKRSLQSYDKSTGAFAGSVVSNALASYGSQFVPTVGGQFNRIIDDKERSTYAPTDSFWTAGGERFAKQMANKIPGLSFTNEPIIDQYGQEKDRGDFLKRLTENTISPGKIKTSKDDPTTNELDRLYRKTGVTGAIPNLAPKSIEYDGQKYIPDGKENTAYQKTMGKTSKQLLDNVTSSKFYAKLTDEEKAKVASNINTYAGYVAKAEFFGGRKVEYKADSSIEKAKKAKEAGIPEHVYLMTKTLVGDMEADKTKSGKVIIGSKKRKVIEYIRSLGIPMQQQKFLYNLFY